MYIIEEGKAYLVEEGVGYLVNFSTTGKMLIDKEKTIDVLGKVVYSFEEMYAKLNIAYMTEVAKKEMADNDTKKEIIEELNKLTKENEELKEIIKSLEVKEATKEENDEKETASEASETENFAENNTFVEENTAENIAEDQKVETNAKRKK